MVIMTKRKKKQGTELPNQKRIQRLGEIESYKYLGILKTGTKQPMTKEKVTKENFRRIRKLFKTKLQ